VEPAALEPEVRLAPDSGRDQGISLPTTTVADAMLLITEGTGYEARDIAVPFGVLSDLALLPFGRTASR
jgi:hypothetical protein